MSSESSGVMAATVKSIRIMAKEPSFITLPLAKIAEKSVKPVETEAVTSSQTVSAVVQSDEKSRTKLLVVDDENQGIFWAISSKVSSATFILRSGSEALSVFREREFDGIFTDVGMPGMSGWELAREIRQINKEIPIAVITGWGEAVGSNEQKAAGDWIIAKPFTADRIAELVYEVNKLNATRHQNFTTAAA